MTINTSYTSVAPSYSIDTASYRLS